MYKIELVPVSEDLRISNKFLFKFTNLSGVIFNANELFKGNLAYWLVPKNSKKNLVQRRLKSKFLNYCLFLKEQDSNPRVQLDFCLHDRQSFYFMLDLTGLAEEGEYNLYFDLVVEGQYWLRQKIGCLPVFSIEVEKKDLSTVVYGPTGVSILDYWFNWKMYCKINSFNFENFCDAAYHYLLYGKAKNLRYTKSSIGLSGFDNKIRVKLTGPLKSLTGYGSSARNYAKQLMSLDLNLTLEPINIGNDFFPEEDFQEYFDYMGEESYYNFQIIVLSPTQTVLIDAKADKVIWAFFWETNFLRSDMAKSLNTRPLDLVVSTSNYLNEILLESGVLNSFYKVRHFHDQNLAVKTCVNKIVKFYCIAQLVTRKNLIQTIDCFVEEFKNVNDVEFTIKVSKHGNPVDWILNKYKNCKNINFIVGYLSDSEMADLHKNNDIFYLCQHSEGYGIPHVEAYLYGSELVTNSYGALADFLNDDNSYLIPYHLEKVKTTPVNFMDDTIVYYPGESQWAFFDDKDIKKRLREAYENFKTGKKKNLSPLNDLTLESTKLDWMKLFKKELDKKSALFGPRRLKELPASSGLEFDQKLNLSDDYKLPLVSIVTSLKGAGEYLDQFIEDVLAQTIFSKCEWIIIDANEDDSDYLKLKSFISYENVKYFKKPNIGIYEAWNFAIKASNGEFITNMNCDDRRAPYALEKQAAYLLSNPDFDISYNDSYLTFSANINWDMLEEYYKESYFNLDLIASNPYTFTIMKNSIRHLLWYNSSDVNNILVLNLPHNNPMWRKSIHAKVGYFDEDYIFKADYDFWLRCYYNKIKFIKYPEVLGIYYCSQNELSTSSKNYDRIMFEINKIDANKYAKQINM